MQNARHPKTHRELCELACRFLRNNGFKVVFSDRFHAWTSCGEHPDALGFRNGASCLIEVKCSRSDFLADRKKVFRSEPEKGMGDWRFISASRGLLPWPIYRRAGGCCMRLTGGSGKCMAGPEIISGWLRSRNRSGQTNRLNAIICSVLCVGWKSGA